MNLTTLQTIRFFHENGLAHLRVSPCWHTNGLARTAANCNGTLICNHLVNYLTVINWSHCQIKIKSNFLYSGSICSHCSVVVACAENAHVACLPAIFNNKVRSSENFSNYIHAIIASIKSSMVFIPAQRRLTITSTLSSSSASIILSLNFRQKITPVWSLRLVGARCQYNINNNNKSSATA